MPAIVVAAAVPSAPNAGLVSPLVLTFNEAPNIGRCLDRLTWAARVVVLDSGSTDDTVAIARRFANVDLHTRAFDTHTAQWNHGLSLIRTPWTLSLDADYRLSDDLVAELKGLPLPADVDALFAGFRYCIFGRPLRASLYPPRAVLFRPDRCRYQADGHTQRLVVQGGAGTLRATIDHDDRKPLDRWVASQMAYASLEADKLLSRASGDLSFPDRLRRTMLFGSLAIFFYTLVWKGTILDGWPGWYYTLQRTVAEVLLSLQLLDRRLRR